MRTQFVCLAFVIILLCPNAHPQWVQTNGPYGGKVNALGVSGTNLFAGTEGAGVFLSTNNGTIWTAVNSGVTDKYVVSFLVVNPNGIGEPNIFAGTWGGGIFRSSDNGTNWTEVDSGLTDMYASCVTTSSNEEGGTDIFACIWGENPWGVNMFLSTNNGTSWKQINTELMYPFIDALAVVGTDLFVGASWGGGLLRFADYGTSWVADSLLTSISVYSLAVSGDSLFAGTSDGVFLFADNDTSCIQVNSGLPSNTYVYTLAVSGRNLFANAGLGGVYLSTNSGLSWSPANSGLTPNGWPYITAFAFIGTNIFAGTSDGVWRRPLSEMITAVESLSELSSSYILEQNYPNPFNPSTTISYGLPNRSLVTLTVFNTLGQQVALLQNGEQEAGYHEVKFDGSGLSSDVYFYRIEAGSFVQTRKLLLIR